MTVTGNAQRRYGTLIVSGGNGCWYFDANPVISPKYITMFDNKLYVKNHFPPRVYVFDISDTPYNIGIDSVYLDNYSFDYIPYFITVEEKYMYVYFYDTRTTEKIDLETKNIIWSKYDSDYKRQFSLYDHTLVGQCHSGIYGIDTESGNHWKLSKTIYDPSSSVLTSDGVFYLAFTSLSNTGLYLIAIRFTAIGYTIIYDLTISTSLATGYTNTLMAYDDTFISLLTAPSRDYNPRYITTIYRDTGTIAHNKEIPSGVEHYSNISPIKDGIVYGYYSMNSDEDVGSIFAFSASDGTIVWEYPIGYSDKIFGNLFLYNNILYGTGYTRLPANAYVWARNIEDGTILWKTNYITNNTTGSYNLYYADQIIVNNFGEYLYIYNYSTHRLIASNHKCSTYNKVLLDFPGNYITGTLYHMDKIINTNLTRSYKLIGRSIECTRGRVVITAIDDTTGVITYDRQRVTFLEQTAHERLGYKVFIEQGGSQTYTISFKVNSTSGQGEDIYIDVYESDPVIQDFVSFSCDVSATITYDPSYPEINKIAYNAHISPSGGSSDLVYFGGNINNDGTGHKTINGTLSFSAGISWDEHGERVIERISAYVVTSSHLHKDMTISMTISFSNMRLIYSYDNSYIITGDNTLYMAGTNESSRTYTILPE